MAPLSRLLIHAFWAWRGYLSNPCGLSVSLAAVVDTVNPHGIGCIEVKKESPLTTRSRYGSVANREIDSDGVCPGRFVVTLPLDYAASINNRWTNCACAAASPRLHSLTCPFLTMCIAS